MDLNFYAYWYYSLYHWLNFVNPAHRVGSSTCGLLGILQGMLLMIPVLVVIKYLPVSHKPEIFFVIQSGAMLFFYLRNDRLLERNKMNIGLYSEYKQNRTLTKDLFFVVIDLGIFTMYVLTISFSRPAPPEQVFGFP